MGISGLLPLLKSIHKPCNLKKFDGQTIGVDAYGWLHRGTASCAIDLALDKPTTKYVDFAMHRVRMLVHFGVTPYIVFDGDYLPSKAGTETERAQKRKESKRLGLELLKMGKTSQAHLELQKSVDVTPEMARLLIEELKHHNIQYVVAPYEADSQLVYLEQQGLIDGILSEDSDLLVFGAKCLLTKLDKYGECIEISRNLFTACREISLVGWSDADFRRMAMLSGCDYHPGIGGVGLKTAHRLLRKHKTVERVVKAAQFEGQYTVPAGFIEAFMQAENTFLYQWVFCPITNEVVNLTPPAAGVDVTAMPYIGKHVPSDVATGVANGNLHPHTKQPIVVNAVDRSHTKPLRPGAARRTTTQTPTSKNMKPIDSFFKPRRIPLAELDPNIFTPSPSQQAIIEQQRRESGGWAAVPAPLSVIQAQRPSVPRTAPLAARRTVSDNFANVARGSAPQRIKRQRLCSDGPHGTPGSNAEVQRSHFFASSVAEPSPSLRTANQSKSKRKTSTEFDLYSDDSFSEAIAELADLEESLPKSRNKLSIFRDESRPSSNTTSQSTTVSKYTTGNSQASSRSLTQGTSRGNSPPDDLEETVFSAPLSAMVKDLRSKFSFTTSPKPEDTSPSTPLPKASLNVGLARAGPKLSSFPVKSAKEASGQAEIKNNSGDLLNDEDHGELHDSAWFDMEAEVVVGASDIEVFNSSPLQSSKIEVRGSEDLLVPDSEAESDCSPGKPMLNLGRFAFSG